jgi:tetratricopeptide (TPR) repeat protein
MRFIKNNFTSMKYIYISLFTLLFVATLGIPQATRAGGLSTSALSQIKALMEQYTSLQKQLATVRSEVSNVIAQGLTEGSTSDDVKRIQALLATDPAIYPEGLATGYYGPLTREALKRFQVRHKLEVTGKVDDETRTMLQEYLHETPDGQIKPGLLKTPGIVDKVEQQFALSCDQKQYIGTKGPLCTKLASSPAGTNGGSSMQLDQEAEKALGEAQSTIDEVAKALGTKDSYVQGTGHTTQEILADARKLLADAHKEYNNRMYTRAQGLANQAKNRALEAKTKDSDSAHNVTIRIESVPRSVKEITVISFVWGSRDYITETKSTKTTDVLKKVASTLNTSTSRLNPDLKQEVTTALVNAKNLREETSTLIKEAKKAIEDAEDLIPGTHDTAEALIEAALENLTHAESEFSEGKYESAQELANEAINLAEEVELLL